MSQASAAAQETELAARAREGDQRALTTLYERHRAPLLRHARRMLGDEAAARDVVQETYARAIAAMPRTEGQLKFKAWVFRIATNLCLRELTRRSRLHGEPREVATAPEAAPDRSPRQRQLGEQVRRALQRLPARYRKVLLARELDELSYDELAVALGTSRATVKVLLHRARRRFFALFCSELMAADPDFTLGCDALGELRSRGDQRAVERHLESCGDCAAEATRRPTGGLFGVLPLLTEGPTPADVPSLGAAAAAKASGFFGWPSPGAIAAWGAGLIGTGGLALAIYLATTTNGSPVARAAQTAPIAAARTEPAVPAQREPEHSLTSQTPGQDKPRPTATAATARWPSPRRATTHPGRATSQPTRSTSPASTLKLKLRFAPGTVTLRRQGQTFSLRRGARLQAGDVLATRHGRWIGVVLPGHQWLSLRGSARLVTAPISKTPAAAAEIALLGGTLRAKASRRGLGLMVTHNAHTIRATRGEFRLTTRHKAGRVEVIEGEVQIEGPRGHATVARRSGLDLQAWTRYPLSPPARELRPGKHLGFEPPLLTWEAVPGARGYLLIIGGEADFLVPTATITVRGTAHRPRTARPGKHFWKVLALGAHGPGLPSKIFSYDIARFKHEMPR